MAHLSLRVRGVSLRLDASLELGAGGEARVFALPGDHERVAKIYRRPSEERGRKIARMIAAPPILDADPEGAVRLAWPQEGVVDEEGRPVGFLMPRAEGPRIFEFYNPVTRRARAPLFHYGLLHRTGANLAAAFAVLHERGYVVGDVNESNILVAPDGAVTLVDTDGFQVPDPTTGAVYRSRVGRPEFTPPELQGVAFGAVDRSPAHDRFGLGVLLFLLLMEGTHPFAVRSEGAAEPEPLEDRIRAGRFPHAGGLVRAAPPRLALPFGVPHPAVAELFARCFLDGHRDPSARPAAAEWRAALLEAEAELRRCDFNPQHRFGGHLGDCPWCTRARLLRGRDPFPATAEAARRIAAPRSASAAASTASAIPAPANVPAPPHPTPRVRTPPPQAPLATRAMAAIGPAVTDPAAWIFPLLLLAILPLGLVQGAAGIAAVAATLMALRPPATPRNWSHIVPVMLVLTVLAGMTADAFDGPRPGPAPWPGPPHTHDGGPAAPPPGKFDRELFEEAPEIINRDAVERELESAYPAVARDAGVGGSVLVSFVVDQKGIPMPTTVEVTESSADVFNEPAIQVAKRMRFIPARVGGKAVRVRVQMPITFQPSTF